MFVKVLSFIPESYEQCAVV